MLKHMKVYVSYIPSIGSGDGSLSVEYIRFDGSGDLDVRSLLALYVRGAGFLSTFSMESVSAGMTGLISIEVDAIGFFAFSRKPGGALTV